MTQHILTLYIETDGDLEAPVWADIVEAAVGAVDVVAGAPITRDAVLAPGSLEPSNVKPSRFFEGEGVEAHTAGRRA